MKLLKLLGSLEHQFCINSESFAELKKRKKEVKVYFGVDDINIVAEVVSNNTVYFYCEFDFKSHYDIIQENKLEEQLSSGHLSLMQL